MKGSRLLLCAIMLFAMAIVAGIPNDAFAQALYTPPGPGSANPALQPDGIQVPDVFGSTPNWQLSPPLRKFVDTLAPLGCATTNNLGQCIPVAVPDKLTFPGADYYEIELRRYDEKMHSDLPNHTTLQGYVQVNNGTNAAGTQNTVAPAAIHYLGPTIVAQKGRPVRIKFTNKLPLQNAEPFFLPVDEGVMGAGMGPLKADGTDCNPLWDPRLGETKPDCASYTRNRADLHLHGGFSPWISDGTPHQWITPAGENTPYKKGTSVRNVPDMWFDANGNVVSSCAGAATCGVAGATNDPGDGSSTYYYTNDQSARLMFYHDHAFGITRLNVYAGEAAGYLIQDPTEKDLVDRSIIPVDQIPLVIQDKSFVDASTIGTLDPTWVWGTGTQHIQWLDATGAVIPGCDGAQTCAFPEARKMITRTPKTGDLWWPHVYMPAENPYDLGGVNPMGRWVYGLYFWPPTTGIKFLPVANPYFDCDPLGVCNAPWEPPTMPATPNPSWVAEAFVDTPMVNGTVFPKLTVQPKAYRLRILNAAHDRTWNLQLYKADSSVNPNIVNPACNGACATNTEVKMLPAIKYAAFPDWDASADQREGGVPDPATAGPAWIQIGNEGGFLPAPAVIPSKPISYVMDPTLFNVGNVNDGSLILAPAERADVIVDFSQYAGQTLILYNDAPAAFPAFVPNNDYYTGAPDLTATGGHPGPKAGMGPNTRTIMQIQVAAATPAQPFNLSALTDEFTSTGVKDGVFKKGQHPVIVGQTAYNTAFNTTFPSVAPYWGIANIGDQAISFSTLNESTLSQEIVNSYPLQPKALHDEMGAVWDDYGRMSAKLGVELPNTSNINQIFVMQNYADPPTELLQDGKVQIWKLTHNGVDTHPLHFHLFDVQVLNRVGWDGFVRLPWPNELGWKETVRVSPLEDTIVALRPKAPPVPFAMADSARLLEPAMPVGVTEPFMNLDPLTGQAKVPADTNQLYDYGAEYVWHCHILSHEEQDMMRAMVLRVALAPPLDPTGLTVTPGFQKNTLAWTDNSFAVPGPPYNTTLGFRIERCDGACDAVTGAFAPLAEMTLLSSAAPQYIDRTVSSGSVYTYRVIAYNRYTNAYTGPAAAVWTDGASAPAYSGPATSLTWQPATGVSLTADFPSPHSAPVKFIALGSGATVPYQYRFWIDGALAQDYSATRYWVLPTSASPGAHTVAVDVRTNYAVTTPDVSASLPYDLSPIVDSTPPVTTAIPAAGAFTNPVTVYLSANEAGSIIKYTIDGSEPTTSVTAQIYTAPINISATTTLKYSATDPAGNAEAAQSGLYELRSINLNASVLINGGALDTNNTAVALTISATGATLMRFSNDGSAYSADEPYATSKAWTLATGAPDGPKTVYVRFTDTLSVLQDPVIAQIILDTVPPVTSVSPAQGTFISPVTVAFTTDHPIATIRYTLDGSDPKLSATALNYTVPFTINATTAVTYYATDTAGNAEVNKTAIYTIHTADLTVNSFLINNGAGRTNSPAVTLTINASDATGVSKMRFSNDGASYSADEPYATTNAKAWTLGPGDGVKSVYVRFTDGAGLLYEPVIAQILLDTAPPVSTAIPAAGVFLNPMNVFLSADETGSVIRYTIDGSDPAASPTSAVYGGAINIPGTTTLKYFATDPAGNAELVTTATYTITTPVISASVQINGGATVTNNHDVTLGLSASGMATMRFSNNGVNYSPAEPYAASKSWALDPGDGAKTVYVRFADGAGNLSDPVVAQITVDTAAPITAVSPIPGTYAPLSVTLTANEPAVIYYTTDGSTPTTASTVYTVPVSLAVSATIAYFAVDLAGNAETVKTSAWTINIPMLTAAVRINNGATATKSANVVLSLSASTSNTGADITGMQFSNDGITYSALEAFAASKVWDLAAGDGLKTVYVKFTETGFNSTITYSPIAESIELDTVAPATAASPVAGTYSSAPVLVTLSSNETGTIYYTTNGSVPTAASPAYTGSISVAATATIKYFAVDAAGNAEAVKTGVWTINTGSLTASVLINGGTGITSSPTVTLALLASAPSSAIVLMQFSNDGTNYTAEEAYATSKTWTLAAGDGVKTVYARFRDDSLGGGFLFSPVSSNIVLDTTAPVTSAGPVSGAYSEAPVTVTLTANEPAALYYTTDGSVPTTASAVYSGPIPVNVTTTLRYFAVDAAGNVETVKSGTWEIHTPDLVATAHINNGALRTNTSSVTLNLSAVDPLGVAAMQFSNDNIVYSAEESYAADKAWTLPAGDGLKTVFVRFRDNTLPAGYLYPPISASITLDTAAPVTSSNPAPGIYASAPVAVTLAADEPATIFYTLDGSTPTTASAIYTAPLALAATSTVKYFAVDAAGNAEQGKSGAWTINTGTLTASMQINSGAAAVNSSTVLLSLLASAPTTSIVAMQFSNDGSAYSAEEPYAASKLWDLAAGDGMKTVYVRFRDNSGSGGYLFTPITASIKLDTSAPTTAVTPVPGEYVTAPLAVTLSPNEPATVYYTVDGSAPTTASAVYTAPISVSAATMIRYFAVDAAGNTETAASGIWSFHTSDLVASVQINNNASHTNSTVVGLTLSAVDPLGIATMQFSDDGSVYSPEEPYATAKAWTLPAGDGTKTIYVRFRDRTLPDGVLYPPVSSSIILDTTAPATTVTPVGGTYAAVPIMVTLSADEPANIYYTTDGATPTAASTLYMGQLALSADTTIKYMAVDTAGNKELVKTGTWNIHVPDLVGSLQINNGAAVTKSAAVVLTLSATDPAGVSSMQFSNDGVGFAAEEPYGTSKAWTLAAGNGPKTVYVRFKDGLGVSYGPFTATITLDTIAPATTSSPVPGIYSAGTVAVTLAASEPAAIYYTTDGTQPDVATSAVYSAPIPVSSGTVTIRYFAVDTAGNGEVAIKQGTWTIDSGGDLTASVAINNSASRTNNTTVALTLAATDPSGIAAMQFSNDGVNYTAEEPYATGRAWTVASGDGVKTVYVRFRDAALGGGNLYPPVTAGIVLDTAAPGTTISPVAGSYLAPVTVSLWSNETATVYYTLDGTTPTTASAVYTGAFPISGITTVGYFGVDQVGNTEAAKSATFTTLYPVVFVPGANGMVTGTLSQSVGHSSSAAPVTAVPEAHYHFVNWTGAGGFVTTTTNPLTVANVTSGQVITANFAIDTFEVTVSPGLGGSLDPASTQLVDYNTTTAFTVTPDSGYHIASVTGCNGSLNGATYTTGVITAPCAVTAAFALPDGDLGHGGTVSDALRALLIAAGNVPPSVTDLEHGDVAPLVAGKPQPDGKITLGDVLVILRKTIGLVNW